MGVTRLRVSDKTYTFIRFHEYKGRSMTFSVKDIRNTPERKNIFFLFIYLYCSSMLGALLCSKCNKVFA